MIALSRYEHFWASLSMQDDDFTDLGEFALLVGSILIREASCERSFSAAGKVGVIASCPSEPGSVPFRFALACSFSSAFSLVE